MLKISDALLLLLLTKILFFLGLLIVHIENDSCVIFAIFFFFALRIPDALILLQIVEACAKSITGKMGGLASNIMVYRS